MSDPPEKEDGDSPLMSAAAVALPPEVAEEEVLLEQNEEEAEEEPEEANGDIEFWEAPIFAQVETIAAGSNVTCSDQTTPSVSTENILAWSKPQYKGLTVYFAPDYKPSDDTAWSRLKQDLQEAAASQGFSLVSKGCKGKSAADKIRQVLICARGRVVPNSRREKTGQSMRPKDASECCRFRLTVHQDLKLDRFFVKGGQNNPQHKAHSRMEEEDCVPKKKRARKSAPPKEESDESISPAPGASSSGATNVVWHPTSLTRADRWKNHKGAVLWFTGLSGSGKSSVANEVEVMLSQRNIKTYLLDGDNLRHGLCSDLAFSATERNENLRRTAEVAKLLADAGMVVLAAFVSPYEAHRELVQTLVAGGDIPFVEIYVKASLETCEKRDPKGLYVKARAGFISNFTGISDPYEEPKHPHIVLNADTEAVQVLADQVVQYLDFTGKIENGGGGSEEKPMSV